MKRIAVILVNAILCVYLVVGGSVPAQASRPASQVSPQATGGTNIYLPLVMRDYSAPLPTIIPDTTKVLPATTTDYLASVSSDGVVFTFTQSTPELAALAPGDIIVGDTSSNAPDGFLRKVVSVENSGGNVVIQTSEASLTDAIEQGSVRISQYLQPDSIETGVQGLRFLGPLMATQNPSFTIRMDHLVLYDKDKNTDTTNDQVFVDGSITLSDYCDFNYDIKNHKLRYLLYQQTVVETSSLQVTANIAAKDLSVEKKYNDKPIHLADVTVWVNAVPIVTKE